MRKAAVLAVATLCVVTAATCLAEADRQPLLAPLVPVASSDAPLSENSDIALVSEDVACVVDSYQYQVHCRTREGVVAGVFGSEGEGPGEFEGHLLVERGADGVLGVMDLGLGRLTLFDPSGALLSDTRIPPFLVGDRLVGNRLFGSDFTTGGFSPDVVEVDALSGSVVWRRTNIGDLAETECGEVGMGLPSPDGGYVFWACDHELVFLDHRDAPSAIVVASPAYVEEWPSDRDIDAYRSILMRFASPGGRSSASSSAVEPYLTRFRERPKGWFLTSSSPFGFDRQDRLWVATTRDRDAFSYFDIWIGTEYIGTVRIRDRLVGFDLLGSTLAALVERSPGPDGVARREIDWYRIDELEFPR